MIQMGFHVECGCSESFKSFLLPEGSQAEAATQQMGLPSLLSLPPGRSGRAADLPSCQNPASSGGPPELPGSGNSDLFPGRWEVKTVCNG